MTHETPTPRHAKQASFIPPHGMDESPTAAQQVENTGAIGSTLQSGRQGAERR